MDYTGLKFAMDDSINKGGSFYREVQKKISELPEELKDTFKIHYLSQPIEEVLGKMDFYSTPGGWFINSNNGGVGFHPNMVASKLVFISLKNNSSQAAVDWFEKIIHAKSASGYCVMLLWGVSVDDPIELYDGIRLLPCSELPPSRNKDWACDDSSWFSMEMHSNLLGKPECALIQKVTVEPFIYHSSDEGKKKKKDPLKEYQRLDEVSLILSVIGPSPTMQAVYWFNYEDEDLDYAQYHGGRSWHNYEIRPMQLGASELYGQNLAAHKS